MDTKIDEIADGIYRLSTFVPEIAPPAGFTFNQFLILGDEPLLFHTRLCDQRSAVSFHPNNCAGSPSATMRPMNAVQ